MKRVVIVHHTGEWGGGTKSLIDLCEMLKNEYKVTVCIPNGYPEFVNKITQFGCDVHEFSIPIPFINIYSGRPQLFSVITLRSIVSLKYIREIGDEILSIKPDVVIFNTLITAITARYLSKHTKVICIDRETLTSKMAKFLYRILLDKYLNGITFLSEYEKNKVNFKYSESLVFPDCVRLDSLAVGEKDEIRRRESIKLEKYAVLFMGGLAKIKGTDVILEAINYLDDRFILIFAGDMNKAQLSKKQLMHDIKYPNYYRFKKRVIKYYYKIKGSPKIYEAGLRDSIDDLILASDIIVFPSTVVHQPRPCIEAGAYSKPVIISNYKETEEYFMEGYNALTFNPCNAHELAEKIMYAYEHSCKMQELGRNNRIMTEAKHDFYDCKKIICSLVEKVCKDEN